MLVYDSENAPACDDFLLNCRLLVSPKDYRLLQSASTTDLDPEGPSCRTLDLWRAWEISLRSELVQLRAKKLGRELKTANLGTSGVPSAQVIAREAFSQDTPLQAEDTLNRGRWSYLDELESGHYFDIDKILIYALRLQILERKALFDEQKGRQMFDTVYGEIISPVGVV
jgi:hypothetical protein